MTYRVSHPTKVIKGEITLTASKSESNRALIIQAICEADFEIQNLAAAEDTRVLKEILDTVKANTSTEVQTYDVGAAGTTMRFLTAYLSTVSGTHILTGTERMKNRPIGILVDALRDLGAEIEYVEKDGYPPLRIKGKEIEGGAIEIDGNVSSQYISALMLLSPKFKKGLKLKFKGNVTSVPYIKMTLNMLSQFGVKGDLDLGDNFLDTPNLNPTLEVKPSNYAVTNANRAYTVEGDWSSASYWYSIAALAKDTEFTIHGLKRNSMQGDSTIESMYAKHFGVSTNQIAEASIQLSADSKNKKERLTVLDFSSCPDLAQTVAVTVSALGLSVEFEGLHTLRIKETDRTLALKNELEKIGTEVKIVGDDFIDILPSKLKMDPEVISTYEDHRMAMAFAPLALVCDYVDIEDSEVVKKSYPAFWEDLKGAGFKIEKV